MERKARTIEELGFEKTLSEPGVITFKRTEVHKRGPIARTVEALNFYVLGGASGDMFLASKYMYRKDGATVRLDMTFTMEELLAVLQKMRDLRGN